MRILVCLSTLLLAACSTHTVRHVDVMVAPESVSVHAPSFIAVGDSLTVRVHDPRYSNRYVATPSESTLTAMARAPMFGDDVGLKAIDLRFQPSRTVPQAPPPLRPESFIDKAGGEEEALKEATDKLTEVATRFDARLDSLRTIVAADPAEYARLRLLQDRSWMAVARSVANDPVPQQTAALLNALAEGQMDSIAPAELEDARRNAELYARRLAALRALLPAEPAGMVTDNSRVGELLDHLGQDLAEYRTTRALWEAVSRDVPPAERPEPAGLPAPWRVSGIDIRPWLESPEQLENALDAIQRQVAEVNEQTERLARALNELPAWTRTSEPSAIFTQLFPSEKEVKVVVVRRDRYQPFTTTAITTAPAAPKKDDAAAEAGAVTVTTTTTVRPPASGGDGGDDADVGNDDDGADGGGAEAAAAGGATTTTVGGQKLVLTPLTAPRVDTVAVVNIPVLQRYRFHLGVGMVYSTLETGAFEARADTMDGVPGVNVVRVGTDENRLLPMAMLSYTLLPFGGRYVDGRAYRRLPIFPPNLSVQAGVSLSDPTEQLYAGVSAELFPGLDIGVGHHFGYFETTTREGDFVPENETAMSKKWLNEWAYVLTLDAQTFVDAFGTLFGLK